MIVINVLLGIVILGIILYIPNLAMIFETVIYILGTIAIDYIGMKLIDSNNILISNIEGMSNSLIILNLVVVGIMIMPWFLTMKSLKNTMDMLFYNYNKEEILEKGEIEKGIIKKIKAYAHGNRSAYGYYLIVDFKGEKIRSFNYSNKRIKNTSNEEQYLYNVGDEIDVILYKNKKIVKLYDMK